MKTVISVKVDKDVRDRARDVARSMGLPLSTIVNYQLKQFGYDQHIEFTTPLVPNTKTRKELDRALEDIRENRKDRLSPLFTDMKDMDRYLDNLRA
ncbi:MAG: type II toxin-antitoxin system RelB/DinJ family antitoxin [Patescibacteria group bacterium]